MNQLFIEILNNALISSFLIIAVIVVRLFIKKAPRWITCALWGLVAIKLVLLFKIESVLSLVPSAEPIPADIEYSVTPHIETGIQSINQAVNPVLLENFTPQPINSANPLQIVISVCSVVWIIGIVSLLLYLLISYIILRKKVAASRNIHDNVFICDEVAGPFILGMIRPRIFIPSGLSDETMECVLAHEKTHLKRLDFLWKPLGFVILSVYWFNPLCWVSYVLLCRDIEFACDERVTRDRDNNWKAAYCQALLDCNAGQRFINVCPVAFGEVSVKERVKSVLNYKKPAFWMVVTALVICAVVAVCFMTSPSGQSADENDIKENTQKNAEDEYKGDEPEQTYNNDEIYAEGNFDSIMGYSGYYVYYGTYHLNGYYYASDGTMIAHVWGTSPEDVGIVDIDGDGVNELIAPVVTGADGVADVIVYKKFENGIRRASCGDTCDWYDNIGLGALNVTYLKDTNQIEFAYWVDAEKQIKHKITSIDYNALTWWNPDWLYTEGQTQETPDELITVSNVWKDQRDWPCGTISEIMPGTVNGTVITISLKYFISDDDLDMINKLELTEADFPDGYAIVPIGETRTYPVSENCEFIFVDWGHDFNNDDRVKKYDDMHVVTKDFNVFKEYLDTYTSLNHQVFFYDIQDGKIITIYETPLA